MNYPARVFRDLLSTWHFDVTSDRIESLAAELTSQVAASQSSLCLGLLEKEALPKLFGLTFLLDGYGLILRQRYREQGDGIFVFADIKQESQSEFNGNSVFERLLEPAYEFPQAA
ncbi:MAG: hypothetical protein KC422_05555 [Trueperaceae bacterium]|nr:hypothetical protein [Trueperaceae bacterium]